MNSSIGDKSRIPIMISNKDIIRKTQCTTAKKHLHIAKSPSVGVNPIVPNSVSLISKTLGINIEREC